jgi:glutathione synthase/RimK-type ligase-like ATP-grasp enzyme
MPLALATCRDYPHLTPSDQALAHALGARSVTCALPIWDDPGAEWSNHEAVVIRSCWDYHQRSGEFLAWLARLEQLGVPVINPVPMLRWNLAKRYLRELGAAGVAVTPTAWLDRGTTVPLADLLQQNGWSEAVVKPVISATAFGTWRVSGKVGVEEAARFAAELARYDLMVQPYLDSIQAGGELSFIFFAGEFSHAVRKRPRAGDFRVQSDFGGTVEAFRPEGALISQAAAMLAAVPGQPLYARVDACVVNQALMLMELELIEPDLFLTTDAQAPGRMAEALIQALPAIRC